MGTSASNGGPPNSAALIPDFLIDDEPTPADAPPAIAPGAHHPQADDVTPVIPRRFQGPRMAFTAFARSGGSDRNALARSIRHYVSGHSARDGSTGPRVAARRMARSAQAAAQTAGVFRDIRQRGIEAVLRDLNLAELIGQPTAAIIAGIIDTVCPRVENVDEDLARQALYAALLDVNDLGIADLAELNDDQIRDFYASFVCNAIELRYMADVSKTGNGLAPSDEAYLQLDDDVRGFIENAVAARVQRALDDHRPLDSGFTQETMTAVFEAAWNVLEVVGEPVVR